MELGETHPKTDEKRPSKRETAILERATAIKLEWRALISAFSLPYAEPSRSLAHWDHVLRESSWMSEDFMQERLWKQAAAVRVAQEAAKFDRSTLKPTVPKVLASIHCAEFGRMVGGDVEKQAAAAAAPASPVKPHLSLHSFPLLPYFICTKQTLAAVLKHLEDEEISWLARHSKAKTAYEAAFEVARYLRPPEDDDLPCSSKKALLAGGGDALGAGAGPPTKRKIKSHVQPLSVLNMEHTDIDDDMGLAPSSMMGGGGGNSLLKSARRMGGDLDMSREKRKRKARDFNDEDDYMPGAKNSPMPRDRFPPRHATQLLGRPEVTTSGGGVGGGLPSLPSSNNLRQGGRPKTSNAKPGTSEGLPRLDGMQGTVSGSGMMRGPRGSYGTRGTGSLERTVTWSTQDDNVLAAIVTEFGHNWPLVADVLRSYSLLAGQYRRSDACKLRYSALQKLAAQDAAAAAEAGGGEQSSSATPSILLPIMNRSQAKDTLADALPVHPEVLKRHQAAMGMLAARVKIKRQQEHMQLREIHKFRSEQHTSHYKILQSVNQATGSKTLSPLDINPIEQPLPPPPALSGSQPNGGAAQGGQGPSGLQQGQGQQGQGSMQSGQQPHHHPQSSQQTITQSYTQSSHQTSTHSHMHGSQGGAGLGALSPPSLHLGNVGIRGSSPSLGATGQPGGAQLGVAPSQAAAQAAAAAVAAATGYQTKPGGASGLQQQQQGGVMGLMGSGIPPLSNALPGGMSGGMQLGASGPTNGLSGGLNAARSPSPQMQFNALNQQQKNMLQQMGRQGNMQQAGMMRPPLNPQQQVASAAATGGRFPNAGTNIAGQAAGGLPVGGSMTPAMAAQIQKGLMQQAANNPAALQAIQAKIAAATAQQQQQGAALSRGMAQAGAPNPGAPGSMQHHQSLGMNPALQGGAGGFGMQLGGTGGVGFGLPPNPASTGINLQQQYLAQAASINASTPRPQPNSQGGNS